MIVGAYSCGVSIGISASWLVPMRLFIQYKCAPFLVAGKYEKEPHWYEDTNTNAVLFVVNKILKGCDTMQHIDYVVSDKACERN